MLRAVTALLALALAAAPAAAFAQGHGMATSSPGSIYHSSGSAIAKVASDKAGLRLVVQPFTSPNVHIPVVDGGEIDYGLANVYELGLAVTGDEHFAGKPHKNLRAVFIMYPLRTAIFVRKDSPYKTIADLKGARMPDGFSSQKILLPIIDAAYATGGLTRKDMVPVMTAGVVTSANDFIAGKTDGFAFALGSAKVQEANAAVGGIRSLPIPNTPEALAAVRKHLPLAYLRLEQPGPRNPGVLEAMHIIAYDALVFANAKVPDEEVYKLVKVVHENKADLAQAFGPFALFEPAAMAKKIAPIEFHPGAIKFYQEKGQWPPKE
jgi:TRAP transporter TAXI family solute receptor